MSGGRERYLDWDSAVTYEPASRGYRIEIAKRHTTHRGVVWVTAKDIYTAKGKADALHLVHAAAEALFLRLEEDDRRGKMYVGA